MCEMTLLSWQIRVTLSNALRLFSLALQGKTLIARKIGQIFSPARPITVVAGPEIMDKFVGSSEKARRISSQGTLACP
jgi:hypothetical protein